MKKTLYLLLLFMPFTGSADLTISEIMYDLDGTDEKKEWIELHNNGSESVDVSEYYLYESDSYHGLYPDFSGNLASGDYAVIVQDLSLDLGTSSTKKVKSSFSLSNEGEELEISDSEKNKVDSVRYSSSVGANGDGNSLSIVNSSIISTKPSPGKENYSSSTSGASSSSSDSKTKSGSSSEKKVEKFKPYYFGELELEGSFVKGSKLNIRADAYLQKSSEKSIRKLKGFYLINYGDSNLEKKHRRIESEYRYDYSGDYIIFFEYYSSELAYTSDQDPLFSIEKKITIKDQDVKISYSEGSIKISQDSGARLWLESWVIVQGKNRYVFPENSFLDSGSSIRIHQSKLGFFLDFEKSIILLDSFGSYVSADTLVLEKNKSFPKKATRPKATNIKEKEVLVIDVIKQNSETPPSVSPEKGVDQESEKKDTSLYFYLLMFGSLVSIFFSLKFLSKNEVQGEDSSDEDAVYTIEHIE